MFIFLAVRCHVTSGCVRFILAEAWWHNAPTSTGPSLLASSKSHRIISGSPDLHVAPSLYSASVSLGCVLVSLCYPPFCRHRHNVVCLHGGEAHPLSHARAVLIA